MRIGPIKSEKDYEQALTAVEALMTAAPNTPDGQRLDALTTLVEAWEQEHCPIEPPRNSKSRE